MTESDQAKSICRHLDQGAEQVSFRIQSRLEEARRRALRSLPPVSAGVPFAAALSPVQVQTSSSTSGRTPFWWRLGLTAAPALLVLVGLVVGDAMQQDRSAEELAEVDSALLTDEVPLVAYADHGFGVYLKNTRR
jgi:hypothetical protein